MNPSTDSSTHIPATEQATQVARRESKFLRLISEASAPPVLAAVTLPILGVTGASSWSSGLLWGLFAGVMVGVLPYCFIIWKVRSGQLKDRMLTDRKQRHIPNLLAIVSAIVGLVVLKVADAPSWVTAFTAAAILTQVVVSLIALVWKMSLHLTTTAGIVYFTAVIWSPWTLLVGIPLIALVAFSRVVLREHTVAQVIAGATLGGAMLGGFFVLFA